MFFKNAELKAKAFSPDIMEELAQESRLQTAYQKLMAGARIPFDGRELTFPQLTPIRKARARNAQGGVFCRGRLFWSSTHGSWTAYTTSW